MNPKDGKVSKSSPHCLLIFFVLFHPFLRKRRKRWEKEAKGKCTFLMNGTVCQLSLFAKGLSLFLSLFYCHLSVFQRGREGFLLFPFPFSLPSVVNVLNILYL